VPGIIVWGSNVAYYIALASLMSTVLMLIGLVLLVIGLVIPAKAILGSEAAKKSESKSQPLSIWLELCAVWEDS